jgi:unsaturated chondroitin disaccharide hydrolase
MYQFPVTSDQQGIWLCNKVHDGEVAGGVWENHLQRMTSSHPLQAGVACAETIPAALSGRRAEMFERAFALCVRKSRRNITDLANSGTTWAWAGDGDYSKFPEGFFEIGNWTTSFFTGMALLAWQQTEDEHFLQQTLRLAPAYREKAIVRYLDMHHDGGFLYSLYSVALHKLTGAPAHGEVGLAAAEALAQRFNAKGNFIRAWGRLDEPLGHLLNGRRTDNMAIIDCLMNLPLLYWASRETGDPKFQQVAVRHADTTRQYFIRADDSVGHACRFNLLTGASLGLDNACGFNVDSYWARGAAWAIYGFALSHRYTGEDRYLEAALRVARKFIAQLDEDIVPVWDFRLPPGAPRVRDASAAAVAVCGFQELQKLGAADESIRNAKNALLERICRADYLDTTETCRGVLKSAYGNEVAYSSWGDYFLMEALARELEVSDGWW